MGTAFSVTFIEGAKEIPVTTFYELLDEHTGDAVQLKENQVLEVSFDGPAGSRLYLPELQETAVKYFLDEQGDAYVLPSKKPYILYEFGSNNIYPFSYGCYEAKCVLSDKETYYFSLQINAKIYAESHQQMIADIEQFMSSMSYSKMKKARIAKPVTTLHCKRALQEILYHPQENLERVYALDTIEKNSDYRTVMYAAMHPEERRYYIPQNVMNRNTLENEWLKQFVKRMQQILKVKLKEEQTKLERQSIKQLLQSTTQFLNEPWVQALAYPRIPLLPEIFQQNAAYRTVYRSYREWTHTTSVAYGEVHSYKKSADLYEIWGYLYVAAQLKKMGYTMTEKQLSFQQGKTGMIFDKSSANYLQFEKGHQLIRLFFEDELPRYQKDINKFKPLSTFHNNLPDCRLDFWQENRYKGSHIIDFKYRKLERIYNREQESGPDKAFKQLAAYALATQSDTEALTGEKNRLIDRNPVNEAWGVYPFMHSNSTAALREQVMRLLPLTPGEGNLVFCQQLREVVRRGFEEGSWE